MRRNDDGLGIAGAGCGCGSWLTVLAINLTIGWVCASYLIEAIWGKVIVWWGAVLIGMFLGEVAIPASVIVWWLHYFGVVTFPMVH